MYSLLVGCYLGGCTLGSSPLLYRPNPSGRPGASIGLAVPYQPATARLRVRPPVESGAPDVSRVVESNSGVLLPDLKPGARFIVYLFNPKFHEDSHEAVPSPKPRADILRPELRLRLPLGMAWNPAGRSISLAAIPYVTVLDGDAVAVGCQDCDGEIAVESLTQRVGIEVQLAAHF